MAKKVKRPVRRRAKAPGGSKPKTTEILKPGTTEGSKPETTPDEKPEAKKKKKKKHTSEENRGGHFFSVIRMWRLLHADAGRTIFNKQELAKRYFESIQDEENPEPECHAAELEGEFDDDFDGGLDDADVIDGSHAASPGVGSGSGGKTPTPYSWIKERHKRYVQRQIEKLKKNGVGIEDVDELGNSLDEDGLEERQTNNPSAERLWRYNPNGPWAEEFDKLLNAYGVNGGELLAFMALRDLLEDMRGTPHQRALQEHLDKLMRCIPPKLREEAREQSRSYRHSVGNTAKYVRKSADLDRWYAAALQREQVVIDYTTPGEATRSRHLAALSTMFHREENSIYLLGSEKTAAGWGPVRQWKFDRVDAVKLTGEKNPRLADLHKDPLVRPAPDGGGIERLDANRVYDYSAGAWLELGVTPRRLEVVVRVPPIGRPGISDEARSRLQKANRRRAYGWMSWCREKPFHPRQKATIETMATGEKQLRLVVERCYVTEMASRLLRLQDCFEVVEPRELVVLIREYADSISASHGTHPQPPGT